MAVDYSSRLTTAQENLKKAREAYFNALNAQSWKMEDGKSSRFVTNADIAKLAKEYQKWQKEVDRLQDLVDGTSYYSKSAFRVGVKL